MICADAGIGVDLSYLCLVNLTYRNLLDDMHGYGLALLLYNFQGELLTYQEMFGVRADLGIHV